MDTLPVEFYALVADLVLYTTITVCNRLPGRAGACFSQAFENMVITETTINYEGISVLSFSRRREGGHRILAEAPIDKKYEQHVQISIHYFHVEEEPIIAKLSEMKWSHKFCLTFYTSNFSEKFEDFITSIAKVHNLTICTPITDRMSRMTEKMIQKGTLSVFALKNTHQFDVSTTRMLLDSLKQQQFYYLALYEGCILPWSAVIADWEANSEMMLGKTIDLENGRLDHLIAEFGFTDCSAGEKNYLDSYYPQIKGVCGGEPARALILKNPRGGALYALEIGFAPRMCITVLFA